MSLDRDLIDAVRDLDEHELQRLMILARARLGTDPRKEPSVNLRSQYVRCGKDACTSCPLGPYCYAHWTENGKRHSRYVGRLLDEEE